MTTIETMAGILHPPSSQARVIVSLIAYFDESGTHIGGPNASNVFVISGYIAPEVVWKNDFAPKWEKMLDSFELPTKAEDRYFHATELEDGGYPYNRLTATQRDQLREEAVRVVKNCGIFGVASGVVLSAFRKLVVGNVAECLSDNPYFLCFQTVIVEALHASEVFVGERKDEQIAFVFDQHPKWSIQAHELYNRMLAEKDWERRYRLGAISFESKKRFTPLQAADHIAFETWHYMEDGVKPPLRPAMNQFLTWQQHKGRYFDEDGLKELIDQCKRDGKIK